MHTESSRCATASVPFVSVPAFIRAARYSVLALVGVLAFSAHAANVSPAVSITTITSSNPIKHPTPRTFFAGDTVTVNVTATDSDGSINRVEFFANGALLATDAAAPWGYTHPSVPLGTYLLTARATDNAGAVTISGAVEVTVVLPAANQAPLVAAGLDQKVTVATGALLDGVICDDGLPFGAVLSSSWTKLSGPGTVSFTQAGALNTQVNFSAPGVYVLRLTGSDGELAASDDIQITVNAAPVILTQPSSVAVISGLNATFSVAAVGTPAPSYQWYKGTTMISGANSASYTTAATTAADHGAEFSVIVSNSAGSVASKVAFLTVNTAPVITTQPASKAVVAGQSATFSVVATGRPAPTYQWYKGPTTIAGATGPSYTTPATILADSGSVFRVVVMNSVGSVTSMQVTLTVSAAGSAAYLTKRPSGTMAGTPFAFIEYLPPSYKPDGQSPLLIFFHGGYGQGGTDAELNRLFDGVSPPGLIKNNNWPLERPFVVLAPNWGQYLVDATGSNDWPLLLHGFIEFAASHYKIDRSRIYLSGLSAGAGKTLDYLRRYSADPVKNQAAAVALVAHGVNASSSRCITNVHTWTLVGSADSALGETESTFRNIAQAATPYSKDIRLTLYPGAPHDTWTRTYNLSGGHDIYTWLLSKRRIPDGTPLPSAGRIQFNHPMATRVEGNSGSWSHTFLVSRVGGSTGRVSVSYTTRDGLATAASNDYVAISGTLTWENGDTAPKPITITVKCDTLRESDETINLILSASTNGAILGTSTAELNVINDDNINGIIQMKDTALTVVEGNSGDNTVTVKVSRTVGNAGTVTVVCKAMAITAHTGLAGSDYSGGSGTLTWSGGDFSDKAFTFKIVSDTTPEKDELMVISLTSPTGGATVSQNCLCYVKIQNDD